VDKISFSFKPYLKKDTNGKDIYTVTKSSNGISRRYVEGIASGVGIDQHGERMTPHAIQSFMNQANSGDILLYADVHGIKSSEDIGILDSANILPNGDWFVSFRLYDGSDGVASRNVEMADMTWKQINGLPPYKSPRQKGFSVEGSIPDGFIKSVTPDGKRVIDDIVLDGVVIVPKPAYAPSVANAVMKALDNQNSSIFNAKLAEIKISESQYMNRIKIQDAFEDSLQEVIKSKDHKAIGRLFDDYKSAVIKTFDISDNLSTINNQYDAKKSLFEQIKIKYGVLSGMLNQKTVRKASMLSPDESALLQNIKSLLDQLGQLDAGAEAVSQDSPEQAMMALDPQKDEDDIDVAMKGEEEPPMANGNYLEDQSEDMLEDETNNMIDDEDVEKADNSGDSGVTGEDDAEDKMKDGNTQLTEENLQVLKSVLTSMLKKQNASKTKLVAKSTDFGALSDAVLELTKVVKSLNARQSTLDKAMTFVLDGMGVGKEVKKSLRKPVLVSPNNIGHPSQVNNMVTKSVSNTNTTNSTIGGNSISNQRAQVRKSLGEAIPSMFGRNVRDGKF
jgi:hypothetical protein